MNVPVTFKLRKNFPGLTPLIEATNVLLASKEFFLRISTDSEAHDLLLICVYERNSNTPTLSIQTTLDDSVSPESVLQIDNLLKRNQKKSLCENFFLTSNNDISITVHSGTYKAQNPSPAMILSSKDIVHRHEYSFRKSVPGTGAIVSAITNMVNLRDASGYLYSFQASLDNIDSRWFRINIKNKNQNQATVMIRRKLNTVTNTDRLNLSLLNFASTFDAPLMLQCKDDIHLEVFIGIPNDPEKWEKLFNMMSFLV